MKTRTRRVKGVERVEGYCSLGDHWLALTEENFYFKGNGDQRYSYLGRCRRDERERSKADHAARRARRKAEAKPAVKQAGAQFRP